VLRRRRREGEDHQPGLRDDIGSPSPSESNGRGSNGASGPWDSADDYPVHERIDCGSLLIPVREGFEVQINVAEEQGTWVAVVQEESGMQLQAFAAPRSGELWDEVRNEIAENIAESGGSCHVVYGKFGAELAGEVPISAEGPAGPLQAVRFLGYDGPRWFLRGVISGPAVMDEALATEFNELFGDVVVVRGDYPAPPREQLDIRLPEEARQAMEEQMMSDQPDWMLADPFTRGPEITETR